MSYCCPERVTMHRLLPVWGLVADVGGGSGAKAKDGLFRLVAVLGADNLLFKILAVFGGDLGALAGLSVGKFSAG